MVRALVVAFDDTHQSFLSSNSLGYPRSGILSRFFFRHAYAWFLLRFVMIVLLRDIPNRTTAGVLASVLACIDVLLLSDFH
jgi:hypothetical protein